MRKTNELLQEILIKNPATGQTMIATQKTFRAVYQNKGFEIVDRGNAAATGKIPTKEKIVKGEPVSATGSAADIAASLNLIAPDGGPASADNAADGVKEGTDANNSNSDGDDESGFRAAAKRDRGRGSK